MTNLTEHEKLKEICDKIGYICYGWDEVEKLFVGFITNSKPQIKIHVGVREIIFIPEFKERLTFYLIRKDNKPDDELYNLDDIDIVPELDREDQVWYEIAGIMEHLHNPVGYIYNLIKND